MYTSDTTAFPLVQLPPLTKYWISNLQIVYRRTGAGKPVLLVHDITTNSFIRRRLIPFLKPSYDVIAVDLLGCGDSDKPLQVDYSIRHQANLLKEFTGELNLQKLHLAGQDVGGGIVQILSVIAQNKLLDIVLINTIGNNYWPVQPIKAMRTPIIRQLPWPPLIGEC